MTVSGLLSRGAPAASTKADLPAVQGRMLVKIEVLASNQRPIQVTDDLSNFWRDQYPKIKTELSRRYPRHE